MKKLLAILFLFASLTAFGQAQSDASLSTQSTDEIKNKALNQTRLDNFNQDVIQSKSSNIPTANTQTGNYTFALTDIGKVVLMNVGSANDLTVPTNGTVAFPVNTMLVAYSIGGGTTTIQAAVGVTIINTSGDNEIPCQGCVIVLYKTATNTWYLSNGLPGGGGGSVWGAITGTLSDQTDLQTALDGKQPIDSDLTTIAGLTATTDNIIQSVGSAWASRTPTQVKTALSLNNVENTALSTWAGTTNITNVGALTAGSTGTGFTIALGVATVTGDLAFSNLTQGAALSVLGVTGGSTADVASITGTANQVLRINGAGTANAFGSIDLSQSATVGSSILAVANGGTGSATAPWWPITGNTTFTGSVDINGSSSNLLRFNFDNLGTTQTDGAGLGLVNGAAAAAGAQQISPSINFRGHGWKTNATAATQPVEFKIYNLPVQGAAAPTGNLTIAQSINDAANTTLLTLGTDGLFTLTSATSGNGATFRTAANLYIRHNEVGSIFFGNTSNARIGSAAAGTFGVTSGSLAYGADTDHYFSTATVSNITLASSNKYQFSGSFSGTSGTNNGKFFRLVPTYNITGGTIPVYDFIIESTETSFSGPHYGLVNTSTTALSGLGTSTPTALWDVAASSTARASLRIRSGTAPSSPNDGDVWYDGTNLGFRGSAASYTVVKVLSNSGTIDFGSVGSQDQLTSNITVTGAADGDEVAIGYTNAAAASGVVYTGRVSATDTVTITAYNITLAPVDPGSGTFKVSVIKR